MFTYYTQCKAEHFFENSIHYLIANTYSSIFFVLLLAVLPLAKCLCPMILLYHGAADSSSPQSKMKRPRATGCTRGRLFSKTNSLPKKMRGMLDQMKGANVMDLAKWIKDRLHHEVRTGSSMGTRKHCAVDYKLKRGYWGHTGQVFFEDLLTISTATSNSR